MVIALSLLLACGSACATGAEPAAPAPEPLAAPPASPAWVSLVGSCEASALLVAPEGGWLVGDNEDGAALHRFDAAWAPVSAVELAAPVDDVEALARTPHGVFVVGSHSTNRKGEPRPLRQRAGLLGATPAPVDLTACDACARGLDRRPGDGGLDIEGAAWWGGRLWLGLRGPLVSGRALLVPLEDDLARPRARAPLEVDLGGDGIRDLTPWREGVLMVSGPVDDAPRAHRLWWLPAPDARPILLDVVLPPSAEGIALDADDRTLHVVTDGDGKPGAPCREASRAGRVALPIRGAAR
jgi:hypothetical protein